MKFVWFIAAVVIALLVIAVSFRSADAGTHHVKPALPALISSLARDKLGEIRSRLRVAAEHQETLIAKTKIAFKEMHELRDYAFKEEIRAQIMDDLLADEGTLPLAKRILIDHDFAQQSYKEDQAVARVYAIALLEHHAQVHGPSELEATAKHLAAHLAQSGQLERGRALDLDDLVYAYARAQNPEILIATMDHLVQQFVLNEHTTEPVRNGLFFALKPHLGEEMARAKVLSALP